MHYHRFLGHNYTKQQRKSIIMYENCLILQNAKSVNKLKNLRRAIAALKFVILLLIDWRFWRQKY